MDYELILRSDENHSIMIKSFWYLWMIVLIFTTFGFTTGMAVQVITSAFIGSGLELIRVPELLWFVN